MDIPNDVLAGLRQVFGTARMTDDAMDFKRIPYVETNFVKPVNVGGSHASRKR